MVSATEKGLPDWCDSGKGHTDSEVDMTTTGNVKWTAPLEGSRTTGSPVVCNGRVFLGTSATSQTAGLLCLDEQTGRELGRFVCAKPAKTPGVTRCIEGWGVASTPTVEGDRLYFVSAYQEVLCLDLKAWIGQNESRSTDQDAATPAADKASTATAAASDKCIVWKYDLAKELGAVQHHVSSCSVLVHGDFVYVCTGNGRWMNSSQPYHPLTPSLVVLSKATGQLVARDDEQIGEKLYRGQYSSISLGTVNNREQIYFGAGDGVCYAFEPADPKAEVPANRRVTTTLRGPIVQFDDVATTPTATTSDPTTSTKPKASPRPTPEHPLPVETRTAIGLLATTPVNTIPTAEVPDVPLLKKVWWCDCIPEDYKTVPFYAHDDKSDGKGRPCEITGTPVFYKNRVYIAIGGDPQHGGKGSKGNLVCIDATKTGDVTKTGQVWSYDKIDQSISTVAIADGLVYALDESDVLHCLDADTGQCYWTTSVGKKGDTGYDSPVVADGKVFTGTSILSAGKELKPIGVMKMTSGGFSSPCVANGVLFKVSGKRLWAICDKGDKKP
jgi:outer membrane protein assembly factor BamB